MNGDASEWPFSNCSILVSNRGSERGYRAARSARRGHAGFRESKLDELLDDVETAG